jgi:uncharacterized membrane protein SpoIIM required for sporulation/uncharacterized RDD family membrane protein YckC
VTAPARDPAPLDLRHQLGIETPENVQLRFELAGVGSRVAAATMDLLLIFLGFLLLAVGFAVVDSGASDSTGSATATAWITAILYLITSFAILLYFTLFEALAGGRTPGKRALGIRVVMDTGRPLSSGAAVIRNLLRLVDMFFPLAPFLPGLLIIFLSKSGKRLGDLAAGTLVVRDRPTEWGLGSVGQASEPAALVELGPPELTEEEFRLLDRFLSRISELTAEAQTRMTLDLARRFETRVVRRTTDPQAYLVQLFTEERAKRRGRFGTRARPGEPGRVAVTAERFVERKRESWEAFRAVATRIERPGVRALPAAEIPAFAARYREVAADLARAQTYGVDPQLIEYLERLTAAGHNALYRFRRRDQIPIARAVLADFPAAVVTSWRYVLAAFLCFMIPAVAGYTVIRQRPDLADEIVSPVMVSRAQSAADREARGIGYAQSANEELPVIAAAIISNNIMVCFYAFTGGLLAGLFSVYSLGMNGWSLGLGFGVFANYHAALYLGTFVAGHGVLELTAIFISGGAGFRLAHAIIAPGDRTRRDALVVDGAVAGRMIGAVVTLLAIAGTIEGLLSASDAPALVKFGVSGLSAVFLFLYFANGWRYQRDTAGQLSQAGRRMGR